ncbi:hypothetical protein HIM_06013 [Hirsutella minnesotensis 3608]|uniref:PABS domain-containing protein n=1 Tax=Hirsutella minnesotensis 3608 TaxID=1043627 RepID=A0A0F7ZUD3_9HYPO|nr:hypothetical protein HIM_06013 [Hirsutella minnesotensis 3608]
MPAKQRKKPATATAAPAEGFTPERFERELKDLAAKAKSDTWSNRLARQLSAYVQAGVLLTLLGVAANVSSLNLSPVYGSIPAAIWHSKLIMAGCFVGWAGNMALRQALPFKTPLLLPLVALYAPAVQWFLPGYSSTLGARWGPLLAESLTLFPIAVLTAASVADQLEKTRVKLLPGFIADAAPGLGSWAWLKFIESFSASHIQANMGRNLIYTRMGLELALGAVYAILNPSKLLLYAVPPLLHTALFNTHVPVPSVTSSLVSSMMSDGWLLLERRESVTGYVSVVQSLEDGFRAMRCDHSLLGGDWINHRGGKLSEPIYGVFVMLEAVRLAERANPVADKDARALNIGLGVGTTPSTLVTHGINTTVVEIDPVVYEFAKKYFDLKENNPPVLQDAIAYTRQLAATAPESYDYIVHDVFTGGAEPVDLFTLEFLQRLAALLKLDGVIAINYAGDLSLPAPKVIFRTINRVFPTCRVFREMARDDKAVEETGTDFSNMVIFCTKSTELLTFRAPKAADILESSTRRTFLGLEHEIPQAEFLAENDESVLSKNDTSAVVSWHEQSALGHWSLMRTAIPAHVWERW